MLEHHGLNRCQDRGLKHFKNYNFASELVACGEKQLFYWTSKSDAEVDFVIQLGDAVYPLEVKSGTSRNIKSLRSYADKYKPRIIIRTSPMNIIRSEDFINIPLYAINLIKGIDGLKAN